MDQSQIATQHIGVVLKLYGDLGPGPLPQAMISLGASPKNHLQFTIKKDSFCFEFSLIKLDTFIFRRIKLLKLHDNPFFVDI